LASDLERALSKLRFDDQVLGYSLMTKAGRPFVSFAFPDELFPRVKDSIRLYKTDLRLMTIDTEKGLVVLAPVDDNWILTVLYVPELQLGLAIAKTKNVLRLLEGIQLPPPPEVFEDSAEGNLEVLETIAIQAASTTSAEVQVTPAPAARPVAADVPKVQTPAVQAAVPAERKPEDFTVSPSTVPMRGDAYSRVLSLDSDLYQEMKNKYRNFGFDVLMLVDGTKAVGQIADSMFQPIERVAELLKWGASKRIIEVPTAEVLKQQVAAEGPIGRFVKVPIFEGDIAKAKPEERKILELCDGSKTTEDIGKATGLPESKIVQILAQYRKLGLKMVGKTL